MDDFGSTEEVITFCFTDSSIRSNAKGLILEKLHTLKSIFWYLNHHLISSIEMQTSFNNHSKLIQPAHGPGLCTTLHTHLQLSFCISLHILSKTKEVASVSLVTGSEIAEISTLKFPLKMALYFWILLVSCPDPTWGLGTRLVDTRLLNTVSAELHYHHPRD